MAVATPSVFSVQRGTVVTDGIMHSILSADDATKVVRQIPVIRHGIRGVLPEKTKDSVSNPQRTESAKTAKEAIGLEVTFAFRTIPARDLLFACSEDDYRQVLQDFISRFFRPGVKEFDEVCRRMTRNIFNGRWLWRNLTLGKPTVTAQTQQEVYTSEGTPSTGFDGYTDDEKRFAQEVVAAGLLGLTQQAATVTGQILFGFTGAVEVFPSQNMVTNKPKGFARSLYKVDMISRKDFMAISGTARKHGEDSGEFFADMIPTGVAALRDQKIGNAIRTIDTWYPDCNGTPIPVEPNGASLASNRLYRDGKNQGAKDLFKRVDELVPEDDFNPTAAYLIALLIRGGVFSSKSE